MRHTPSPRWLVHGWIDDLVALLLFALFLLAPAAARADDESARAAGLLDAAAESARVAGLLDAAAENARDRRVVEGVAALAAGTTLVGAGVASWATPADPDARTPRNVVGGVFVGVGSALTLAGGFGLLAPSSIEQLRVQQGPILRAGGPNAAAAARAVGLALLERASAARTERRVGAVVSMIAGAAMATGGIALELEAQDHGLVWLGRSLMVASAGSVAVGIADLAVRSEEERLSDLFHRTQRAPAACGFRLEPRIGLGTVGLVGTF